MNWKLEMQKRWNLTRKVFARDADTPEPVQPLLAQPATGTHNDRDINLIPAAQGDEVTRAEAPMRAQEHVRDVERIRSWRRRVLLKRGAAMYASMGDVARDSSLAMLDETGVVIAWYGRTDGNDLPAKQVVDRDVSQFYLIQDIHSQQPLRDLHDAAAEGMSTRQGWRLRAEGTAVWATSVVRAVMLRDGRLQGFSYLTSESQGPSDQKPIAQSLDVMPEQTPDSNYRTHGPTFLPARDRMAKSYAYARRRRIVTRGVQH